jgi:electron transport complex protein RnfE
MRQAELMFGQGADWMTLTLLEDYRGYLLAILPPGAFIGLGLLIALKNLIDKRRAERRKISVRPPRPETTIFNQNNNKNESRETA